MDLSRLDHVPTVKLAMTTFPHSVDVEAPLSRAREMMHERRIHQLPITRSRRRTPVARWTPTPARISP